MPLSSSTPPSSTNPVLTDWPADQERRHHVRAQDAVGLKIQRLKDIPAADSRPGSAPDSTTLPDAARSNATARLAAEPAEGAGRAPGVRRADKYEIDGYADVRRHFPDVAGYINDLEERIRQLLLDGYEAPTAPTHKVSLSAGGIYFADARLLHPGEVVGVTITLFPSEYRIGCDAMVVSANDAPSVSDGDRLTYRVEFLRISDADRQTLEDHVHGLLQGRPLQHD